MSLVNGIKLPSAHPTHLQPLIGSAQQAVTMLATQTPPHRKAAFTKSLASFHLVREVVASWCKYPPGGKKRGFQMYVPHNRGPPHLVWFPLGVGRKTNLKKGYLKGHTHKSLIHMPSGRVFVEAQYAFLVGFKGKPHAEHVSLFGWSNLRKAKPRFLACCQASRAPPSGPAAAGAGPPAAPRSRRWPAPRT